MSFGDPTMDNRDVNSGEQSISDYSEKSIDQLFGLLSLNVNHVKTPFKKNLARI